MDRRLPLLYQYADVQHLQPYFEELTYTVEVVQNLAGRLGCHYKQLVCCVVDDGFGSAYLKVTLALGSLTVIRDKGVPTSVMDSKGRLVAVLDLSCPDDAYRKIVGISCN